MGEGTGAAADAADAADTAGATGAAPDTVCGVSPAAGGTSGAVRRQRRVGGLLWQHDFRAMWIGETSSRVGAAVTGVTLPIIAVVTERASTFEVGLLAAVQWLPWLLIGLPAGAWVDRLPRRPLMVTCNLVSGAAVVSVPVAAAVASVTMAHLLLTAFVIGVAGVFFSTAYGVYVPSLVADFDLGEANAKLQGSESAAQVVGPGLGGVIAQAFGAVAGLVLDAVSFLVSTVCLLLIRGTEQRPERAERSSLRRDIGEGLRFVVHDVLLRRLAAVAALTNLVLTGYEALLIVFLLRDVGMRPAAAGALLMAAGCGGVLGALAAGPLLRWLGDARVLMFSLAATAPFGLLIPLTDAGARVAFFVAGAVIPVAGLIVYNVVVQTFRQQYTPAALLGRVSATMRFVLFGAIPLGGVLGGALGSALGTRDALWLLLAANVVPGLLLVVSPLRRMRTLPARAELPAT